MPFASWYCLFKTANILPQCTIYKHCKFTLHQVSLHLACHAGINITENKSSFLALLVFTQQSYYCMTDVIRPSSIHKLRFLRNRCMGPDQISWETTYASYLQCYRDTLYSNSLHTLACPYQPMVSHRITPSWFLLYSHLCFDKHA